MRIPYGLDRLPRDVTLRSVEVGDEPLRLNTEPVPAEVMPLLSGDHTARVTAALQWLQSQCGEYAPLRRQFIAAYFGLLAAEIEAHRAGLTERLKPYDGLYAPEDYLWSALRPLPRGWVPAGERFLPADIVFWDGTQVIAIELSARDTDKRKALLAAGIVVSGGEPNALAQQLHHLWNAQALPSSPFRRPSPSPPGAY